MFDAYTAPFGTRFSENIDHRPGGVTIYRDGEQVTVPSRDIIAFAEQFYTLTLRDKQLQPQRSA